MYRIGQFPCCTFKEDDFIGCIGEVGEREVDNRIACRSGIEGIVSDFIIGGDREGGGGGGEVFQCVCCRGCRLEGRSVEAQFRTGGETDEEKSYGDREYFSESVLER
jgi:hypothetical protein